jgi:hypothetical protein
MQKFGLIFIGKVKEEINLHFKTVIIGLEDYKNSKYFLNII